MKELNVRRELLKPTKLLQVADNNSHVIEASFSYHGSH